jgi:hypothetical protein
MDIKAALKTFGEFLHLVRGNQDTVERARVVLDPKTPLTSSYLSANQVDFMTVSRILGENFKEMKVLQAFSEDVLLASMSKDGWGVEKMIQHEQAIGERRLMQLGLGPNQPKPEKAKTNDTKA